MIKNFTLLLFLFAGITLKAQNINIPDANFKKALVDNISINTDGDLEISEVEAASFTGEINVRNLSITDLTGIKYFTYLRYLDCQSNKLSRLDLSYNTKLESLDCGYNRLTDLDLSHLPELVDVYCAKNKISSLDLSQNTMLRFFNCAYNQLNSLDIKENTQLEYLVCDYNHFLFSELIKIKNNYPELNYTTTNKVFSAIESFKDLIVDYSSEVIIDGNPTSYKWYDLNDNIVGSDIIKENSPGVFQFQKPGSFYCQMTNPILPETTLTTNTITIKKRDQSITTNSFPEKVNVTDILKLEATASSGLDVSYSIGGANTSLSGNTVTFKQEGIVKIRITQNGNDYFNAVEKILTIIVEKKIQNFIFTPLPEKVFVNDKLDFDISASSSQWVNLKIISGDAFAFSHEITFKKEGIVKIEATQSGNIEFLPIEKEFTVLVEKKEQTITFNNIPEKIFVNDTVDFKATSSSSRYVFVEFLPGKASRFGNKIIFDKEGSVEIKASQQGNDEFSYTEKKMNVLVEKKEQHITFNTTQNKVKVKDVLELDATSNSGLEISFAVVSGDASINGNKITFNKEGEIVIKAYQEGDGEFLSTDKTISILSEKKEQSINLNALPEIVKVTDVLNLNATASSALEVSIDVVSGDASLSNNNITFNKEGKVIIKVSQIGNDEFTATEKTIEILVEKKSQIITFQNAPTVVKEKDVWKIDAITNSNLEIDFIIISGDASLSGQTITFNTEGRVLIQATQLGNEEFAKSEKTIQITVEKKKEQTINFIIPTTTAKVNDVLSLKANASSTLPVSFEIVSGEASLNGNQLTCTKSGILKVKAKQVGNDEYEAAEATVEIAVSKKDQFITFNDVPSEVEATDQLDLDVTISSGLEVSYIIVKGNANIIGNTITFNEVGNVIIKAINAGNDEYNETEQSYLFIVRKKEQEINADNIPSQVTINENLDLNLYASSGLAIDLEIIYGTALLSGTNLNFTEAGEVKVKASQAGNSIYESTETSFTISVIKKDQTLDIQNTSGSVIINETMELIATASSTLSVSFSIILGDAELYGNSITFTSAGDVTIKAKQIGNNEFIAVEQIIEFTVNKKTQTVNFVNAPETGKVNDVIALNTVASSGLEVTFEIVEGEAILNGNQLTYTNSGVVKVKATQAGNDVYESAEATIEITIGKKSQTVSFVDAPTNAKVKDVIELNATSSSSLDVSFEIVEGEAILNSNQLTCTNSGVVKVKATQVGNDEFEAAEVIIEITVEKRDQSIDFANAPTTVKAKDEIELNASATSGLEVTFELVSGDASIDGKTITFNQEGSVEIKAIQAGNDEYKPAEATIKITVDIATGINDVLKSSIQVYPNPVITDLNIKFEKNEDRMIYIYDLKGQIRLQQESYSNSEQLNISDFKSGLYILKIQSESGVVSYKILKK